MDKNFDFVGWEWKMNMRGIAVFVNGVRFWLP